MRSLTFCRSEDDTMHIDEDLPLRYRTAHTSETTDQQRPPGSRIQQADQVQDSASMERMTLGDNDGHYGIAGESPLRNVTTFDFLNDRLCDHIRIKIIKHACEFEEPEKPQALGEPFLYRPLYRAGMRLEMITDGDDPDSSDTAARDQRYQGRDNITWPRATVSTRFAKLYWEAWYSVNSFEFEDPRAGEWWFKNIGDQKLSYVKDLRLSITSGFSRERLRLREPNALLDVSAEARWYGVFSWLQYRHNLDYLTITFLGWSDPAAFTRRGSIGGISEENVEDLTMARANLFDKLWAIRGIAHPKVIDRFGKAFTDEMDQIPDLELGLMQRRESRPQPKRGFAEVLKSTQEQFRMEEMIENRELYGNEGLQVEGHGGLQVLDVDSHDHSNGRSNVHWDDDTHWADEGQFEAGIGQTWSTPSAESSGKGKGKGKGKG